MTLCIQKAQLGALVPHGLGTSRLPVRRLLCCHANSGNGDETSPPISNEDSSSLGPGFCIIEDRETMKDFATMQVRSSKCPILYVTLMQMFDNSGTMAYCRRNPR